MSELLQSTVIANVAIAFVNVHHGLKSDILRMKLLGEFPNVKAGEIDQIISELIQSKQIVRVEYRVIDNPSTYYSFLLPEGSKIV
jgi:hypothetical protein